MGQLRLRALQLWRLMLLRALQMGELLARDLRRLALHPRLRARELRLRLLALHLRLLTLHLRLLALLRQQAFCRLLMQVRLRGPIWAPGSGGDKEEPDLECQFCM